MSLGTENKSPNIVINDVPIAFIGLEIPRIWGVCEPGTVDNDPSCISKICFGQLNDQSVS